MKKSRQTHSATLPEISFTAIAKILVRSLRPSRGERAVIIYDPKYYPDLAEAIELELYKLGVYPITAITHDPPGIAHILQGKRDETRQRAREVVAILLPIFGKADLFLWLPARFLADDLRLEQLLSASHARGVHFHWIHPLSARSPEEIALFSSIYEKAVLNTDYAALSQIQNDLTVAMRGRDIRITTPSGTDLKMHVPQDAWFHRNDGDMSPARSRRASPKAVRDREMEFPAGALRFIPDHASVEGTLVVPMLETANGLVENLMLRFVSGRIKDWRATTNEQAFRKEWEDVGGDVDKIGELVLGTNPLLTAAGIPCQQLYFGYGAGCLRISLGDNWESGGDLRSAKELPLLLFLNQATLNVDGRDLVQKGRILK